MTRDQAAKRPVLRDPLLLFFAFNYLAQGLGGVVYEPLSYLLKDGLGLSAGASSTFLFWMTLPFLVKPLFGLATDLFPVRGRRRLPYLLLVSILSLAAWLTLAGLRSYGYFGLLGLLFLTNIGVVGADLVCDAVMVEQGQRAGKTGFFQAVQIATLYGGIAVTGLGGGWLVRHASMRAVFLIAAGCSAMFVLSARWVREPKADARARRLGWDALVALLSQRRFWAVSAFIFLWSFCPFLGTAQFYYQSNALKLSPVFIGLASTLAGAAGALGAAFYGRSMLKSVRTDQWVRAAVWVGAPLSLLYLVYRGAASVAAVEIVYGFVGVALRLGLMDLAAQSCPAGAEATAFAAYMAVFDLAASASNTAGGRLYDKFLTLFAASANPAYASAAALMLIGTAATLCCWPLIPVVLGAPGRVSQPRAGATVPAAVGS